MWMTQKALRRTAVFYSAARVLLLSLHWLQGVQVASFESAFSNAARHAMGKGTAQPNPTQINTHNKRLRSASLIQS
jgi:hypothetical protein